jgi:hypothetical protein
MQPVFYAAIWAKRKPTAQSLFLPAFGNLARPPKSIERVQSQVVSLVFGFVAIFVYLTLHLASNSTQTGLVRNPSSRVLKVLSCGLVRHLLS